MPVLQLTERDCLLLETLSVRVRILTVAQVGEAYFDDNYSGTTRRLKQLSRNGFIEIQRLVSRSLPELDRPIASWSPGESPPNPRQIAGLLQRRWSTLASRTTRIVSLGKRGARLSGVKHRDGCRHPLHVAHDLGVAKVFLRYLAKQPELADAWIGEDAFSQFGLGSQISGGVVPDALIVDSQRRPVLGVEVGGLYSPRRIGAIHRSFFEKELPYELW